MKKKIDYFDLIMKIIIFLLGILVIYWVIQLIFGGSPTLTQFNNSLILILIGLTVHLYYKIGKFSHIENVFFKLEKNIENSFNKTKRDMNLLKQDISLIKKRLKI